jgi:hypothetical protein
MFAIGTYSFKKSKSAGACWTACALAAAAPLSNLSHPSPTDCTHQGQSTNDYVGSRRCSNCWRWDWSGAPMSKRPASPEESGSPDNTRGASSRPVCHREASSAEQGHKPNPDRACSISQHESSMTGSSNYTCTICNTIYKMWYLAQYKQC